MKKLLITAIGAAAALGASAEYTNAQRFEGMERGETTASALGSNWSELPNSTNTYTIVEMVSGGQVINHPDAFKNETDPLNALSVKTTFGKPLSYNVIPGGTATNLESNLYFDSLVKFTVCEDTPTETYDGAKIVMWLQEQYNANQDITGTNLMVRAGYLTDGGVVATNYTCGNTIAGDFADKWHRVTIKAMRSISTASSPVPGFAIFIDGGPNTMEVSSDDAKWAVAPALTETAEHYGQTKLFPSLIQDPSNPARSTLTCASFDGTGTLNDMVFTSKAPDFAEDYVAPRASVVNDGTGEAITGSPFTDIYAAVAAVNGLSSGTYTFSLEKGMELDAPLEFASSANIILDFAGYVLTNTSASAAAISNAGTLTLTNSTVNVGGIYCADDGAAVSQAGTGALVIGGGVFNGDVDFGEALDVTVMGGSFKNDETYFETEERESGTWIADGKMLKENQETGLYDVVDYVPPTYTITVEGGEHFTVAVTTNEVAAGAAGAYVVTEGDSVAVTYTADTGYTLSKDSDSIASVSADATIAAPVATLQTFKVIFNDGELSTTNVVDYGSSSVGVVPEFAGRTGYTAAWDSDPTAVVSVTSDLTFTAVYTAIEYTITYKTAEGEAFTSWADNYAAPAIFTVAQLATLPTASDVALAVGVTFNGWTNAVGTAVTDTEGLTANLVVFANVTVPGPVTPTIDPAAPAAVEVTAATKQAAIDAVAVPAPAGSGIDTPEELAAYKDLFVIEATNKGGDAWEVELTGIKESVKTEVSEDAVDVLVAAAQSEATTVSVDVPAGLYYKVTTYNTLGGTAVDTETGLSDGTGTTAVDKPASSTQGFIKVEMSTVPFD